MSHMRKSKEKVITGHTAVRRTGNFDAKYYPKKETPLAGGKAHDLGKASHEKARSRRSFSN